MTRIVYLTANNAWAVQFGDSLIGVGVHNQYLFNTRKELRDTLKQCGLKIDGNKIVRASE